MEMSKEEFGSLIKLYFEQLTKKLHTGVTCSNEFCACGGLSNSLTSSGFAALAIRLSRDGGRALCRQAMRKKGYGILALDIAESLLAEESSQKAEGTDGAAIHPLIELIDSSFTNLPTFGRAFYPGSIVLTLSDVEDIQDKEIKNLFGFLTTLEIGTRTGGIPVKTTMHMLCVLETANIEEAGDDTRVPIICALVYILEYLRMRDSMHVDLLVGEFCRIVGAVVTKWPDAANALVIYLSKKEESEMKQFITIFMHYFALSVYSSLRREDKRVQAVITVLDVLNKANTISGAAPYSLFYSDVLKDILDITKELLMWQQGPPFSYLNHAYLLDMATKSEIVHLEAVLIMRQQERQGLRDIILSGQFNGRMISNAQIEWNLFLPMHVRRDNIVSDTIRNLSYIEDPLDLKKQLRVQFLGEEAVDEGGVRKEFFQLLMRDLFSPNFGMFTQEAEGRLVWFNAHATDAESLQSFKLIGNVIGLSIYNAINLDAPFPTVVFKKLKGEECGLDDLREFRQETAAGLEKLWGLSAEELEDVDLRFEATLQTIFGEERTVELKSGGSETIVGAKDVEEYINLYVDFFLNVSVKAQFEAFMEGFYMVASRKILDALFRHEELLILIRGEPVLDFNELKKNCNYDGYSENSKVIKNFWSVLIDDFSPEQQRKFLFFTTGSDMAPIGGLSKLNFIIARNGADTDMLPTSHTCFNLLLLPRYKNRAKLKDRLTLAIMNSEGFGLK